MYLKMFDQPWASRFSSGASQGHTSGTSLTVSLKLFNDPPKQNYSNYISMRLSSYAHKNLHLKNFVFYSVENITHLK
jgi:hypothetical protein